MLEQEVKLEFDDVEAARRLVQATGARLVVSRRLLDDLLFDTPDQQLRKAGKALRIRRDGTNGILTLKGPVQAGTVKTREETETGVDPAAAEAVLRGLGFRRWFRSQKYREEYVLGACRVMIDETPIGVFLELEGSPEAIERAAAALGRSPVDYRLESYPRLFSQWCEAAGEKFRDMTFD